jgi:Ca2+:H+ antiporter
LIGGRNFYNQNFNSSTAATCGMLLLLATMGLIVPTISSLNAKVSADIILKLSRGTAIILLMSYGLFVFFRLKSHVKWFREKAPLSAKRKVRVRSEGDAFKALALAGGGAAATAGGASLSRSLAFVEPDEEPEIPRLAPWGIACTLVFSTLLMAFHTEFATNNFTAITGHLTSSFIGMALLPLFAIDPGCVTIAANDQQDINVDNTLGKCIQVALVVTPIMVILGWMMGISEMTLLFNNFETGTLFMSVIIVNYITSNGKSHW